MKPEPVGIWRASRGRGTRIAPAKRDRRIAGAILAGGKGSRMGGHPKFLPGLISEGSIVEKQIREMASAGIEHIIIVANNPEPFASLGKEVIPDLRAGIGPLAGIEAALAYYSNRYEATLFLPCDLPYISSNEITELLVAFRERDAVVAFAKTDEFYWEPLCVIVSNSILPQIQDAIDRGVRQVAQVWKELGAVTIQFPDPRPFFNINTPKDLARWMAEKAEKEESSRPEDPGRG